MSSLLNQFHEFGSNNILNQLTCKIIFSVF
nr:MAG TPA: hypothetical protein [Caudoviricetes sp.]DAN69213.1 MAG TPA: hypothetical protein [Caudoviricetes sp.]